MATGNTQINGSDPTVLRQIERQTATTLTRSVTAPATVSSSGNATSNAVGAVRTLAPVVTGSDTLYPQSTAAVSSVMNNNAVIITSSLNNDSGDVTTVYATEGSITVNPINQTINQYTSVDSGVSQIIAGSGVTVTSTGASGTGVVTIGSDNNYSNSNVASYLPTYTGNVGAGNVNVTGTVYTNGISSTGLASLTTLNVSTTANLGAAGNVKITGGTNGYVLQTDGAGNLSWTAQTGGGGNGSVAGANTQVQFNDAGSFGGNSGFTFNKTVGALAVTKLDTADVYHLDGVVVENSDLTHGATAALILPANGNTSVPAQLNNTYGNVQITTGITSGSLKNWVFDNTGNLVLPSNSFAVKYANGTSVSLAGTYGNSNVATFLAAFGSNTITTTGNISAGALTVQQDVSGNGALRLQGIAGGNSTINIGGEADIDLAANVGNINLYTDPGLQAWIFDKDGALNLPDHSDELGAVIQATVPIRLISSSNEWAFDQNGGMTFPDGTFAEGDIEGTGNFGFEMPANVGFGILTNAGDNEWSFGSDGNLTLPNNANIAIYGNTTLLNSCPNGFLGFNTYDDGSNNIARVSISSSDGLVAIGVSNPDTEIDYNWIFANGGGTIFPTLTVDLHNGGTQNAQTLQFGDPNQQAVITGPTPTVGSGENAQRLIIQGQRGDTTGEGGDVYIWAGDADNYAGDIKIYAGDADNVSTGYGGYINIEGGQGVTEGGYVRMTAGQSSDGAGAFAEIIGGIGNTTGGSANLVGGQGGVAGGVAYIKGGYGGGSGGNVEIIGGIAGNGLAEYGNVNISAGASDWAFGNDGNLTLPQGGSIFSMNSTPSGAPGNTIILQPAGAGVTTNQQLKVYPTAGDGDHIHVVTGNLYQTELFMGDDNFYMKLANTGNIVINSNDDNGNTAQWTFGIDGDLTLSTGGTLGYAGMGWTGLTSATGTPLEITTYTANGNTASQVFLNDGSIVLFTGDEANATSYSWNYSNGVLTLPGISLGTGLDEQTTIQSQRKIIPPNRYSALIDGSTPTIVYTASQGSLSLKTTLVVQHAGFGLEMFDVSAISAGADVMYSVSNRLNATGEDDTTVVVDWADTQLAITLTVNSGATTCYVTYDSTEFGIAVD